MLRRLGTVAPQYLLVLTAILLLNFTLPRIAPGDPTAYLVPPDEADRITQEQREALLERLGLGEPLHVQFAAYVGGIVRGGDFLISTRYGRPVRDLILERLPWTLLLVGTATVLSTAIGVMAGFRSAWRRGKGRDVATLSSFMVADSMPPFFVGLMLILVFGVWLGVLPFIGAQPAVPTEGWELVVETAKRLILPVGALTVTSLGTNYLVSRPAMVAELKEDYVLMAQAKGLAPSQVRRHAERNALLPVSTIIMLQFGTLVGGSTVVETVFSYPGLGKLIFDSIQARDYLVLQGAFFILAVTVIVANIVVDLTYPLLDPRVRTGAGADR